MGVGVVQGKLPQVSVDMLVNSITASVKDDLKDKYGDIEIYQLLVDFEDRTVLLKYRGENVPTDTAPLNQFMFKTEDGE